MISIVSEDLCLGSEVVLKQAEALRLLAMHMENNPDFSAVLNLIYQLPKTGRLILCGIGKSGHIAVKLAATFASTGTPSFFVHAAEASHGDLGMITPDDILLCLSNSGNTKELSDVLNYCRQVGTPIIGMTAGEHSLLAKFSNFLLLLPAVQEVCPNQLAPTTSTTMMLVLGDALAVMLMRRRNFTSGQFRSYHPGGKLGDALRCVADIMKTDNLPLVRENQIMRDVFGLLCQQGGATCVGITDDQGYLKGVMNRHEILDVLADSNAMECCVGKVMLQAQLDNCIQPQDSYQLALEKMKSLAVFSLLVVQPEENGLRPIGYVVSS